MILSVDRHKTGNIVLRCDECQSIINIKKGSYSHWLGRNQKTRGAYICTHCSINNSNHQRKQTKIRVCQICGDRRQLSSRTKMTSLCLKCSQEKATSAAAIANVGKSRVISLATRHKISDTLSDKWRNDQEYVAAQREYRDDKWRAKISESISKKWANKEYSVNKTSWLNKACSAILTMLGVDFEPEFMLSECVPVLYDFRIGDKLIELDGDYWHSLPNCVANDKRKTALAKTYHYKLLRLHEHEVKCFNLLVDKIIGFLGITLDVQRLDFNAIEFKRIELAEASKIIDAFHYLGKPRRSGIAYGAMVDDAVAGIVLLQRPMRQESATSMGVDYNECYEITRIIVNPRYHKTNLISWMLARVVKDQRGGTNKLLISFADTTFGHTGAVYKASNFKLVSRTKADYCWAKDGHMIHKKTMWDHAKKMSRNENDFAKTNGYVKVFGKEKLKFCFWLRAQSQFFNQK